MRGRSACVSLHVRDSDCEPWVLKLRRSISYCGHTVGAMSGITHRFVKTNGINMHFAEAGSGPLVLLLHGFPDFWFTWRYQIPALAKAGFHVVAPDMRGFGQTDAPAEPEKYTVFDITGDLIGLIDILGAGKKHLLSPKNIFTVAVTSINMRFAVDAAFVELSASVRMFLRQVFVIGHDWGAEAAWALALFRPDRVRAVATLSVPYAPRLTKGTFLANVTARLGEGFYMAQFQKPGYAEAEIARVGLSTFLRETVLSSQTSPLVVPEGKSLGDVFEGSSPLTSWFNAEDLDQYVQAFKTSGLTGPINVYRAIQRTWELQAPYTKARITSPAFFIAGSKDIVWHVPGNREYVEGGGLKHFVPNLRSYVVLDSGHFIQQEKHEQVNDLFINFLRNELQSQSKL